MFENPEAPEPQEQRDSLLQLLQTSEKPESAAGHVLSVIYSRMQASLPALRPAASELS